MMEPEIIHIDNSIPFPVWADTNRNKIMSALYNNIFEFVSSGEDKRCVLRVISKLKTHKSAAKIHNKGVSCDFIITKQDINETIDKLINHLVEFEEYEKCAELVKLKDIV